MMNKYKEAQNSTEYFAAYGFGGKAQGRGAVI